MEPLSPLVEYLLAVPQQQGSMAPLCKMGNLGLAVPIFTPNTTIPYTHYPDLGVYANIQFYLRFSPMMVPDSFYIDINHNGIAIQSNIIGSVSLVEGYSHFLVVTQANPIYTRTTNISGLNQFFELVSFFLTVTTKEDYDQVIEIIKAWPNMPDKARR